MSPPLERLTRRIDGMSLRERVFLFIAVAALLLAIADQAVISPTLQRLRTSQQPLRTEAEQLATLRSQLMALSQAPESADGASSPQRLRQMLDRLGAERQRLQASVQPPQDSAQGSGDRLPDLLNRVLQRHGQLTLQSLRTQPQEAGPGASAARPDPAGWQSVALSVSGGYADLQRFIGELETGLPGLRWGTLQLDTEPGPPLLRVVVWMPGVTP